MKTLVIFYDPRCGLCGRFRGWLDAQPKWVRVEFIGHDTPEAEARFAGISGLRADRDLVVLADDGRWWQGSPAWLTCLWTTVHYRDWSFRLASPALQPFVKEAIHLLSENRLTLSRLMRLRSDHALAAGLDSIPLPACNEGACPVSNPAYSMP